MFTYLQPGSERVERRIYRVTQLSTLKNIQTACEEIDRAMAPWFRIGFAMSPCAPGKGGWRGYRKTAASLSFAQVRFLSPVVFVFKVHLSTVLTVPYLHA